MTEWGAIYPPNWQTNDCRKELLPVEKNLLDKIKKTIEKLPKLVFEPSVYSSQDWFCYYSEIPILHVKPVNDKPQLN